MPVQIDCDFPGGNIVVEGIDRDEVRVHQDLRDTDRDWFYWCFRVRGAGRTLHVRFTRSRAMGVRGPGLSRDEGRTWSWLGAESLRDNGFVCTVPDDAPEVRLSFAMPYQYQHWQRFMASLGEDPRVSRRVLCTTRKGRPVEYDVLGDPDRTPRHLIALTCRHHCCEMMADYALEGLLRWFLHDAGPHAGWLRDHAAILVVPFVDFDGVEDGDQGKGRRPRDHGRDYEGDSLYATTGAIRTLLPEWGADRLHFAMDIHCPWIAGKNNEVIYLVGAEPPDVAEQQRRLSAILEEHNRGPLPFRAEDFLPFGTDWNTGANFAGGKGFARWARELPGIWLCTSIEIPYANVRGAEVNAESARGFGRDLGTAIAAYLQAQESVR